MPRLSAVAISGLQAGEDVNGSFLAGLNPEQHEAATADGHCLVTACPGSGKTKTLAAKAARILADGRSTVCAVTFTRESALEIRERIEKVAGTEIRPRLLVGTFHALCWLQQAPRGAKRSHGSAILGRHTRPGGHGMDRAGIATEGDRRSYVARAIEMSGLDLDEALATQMIETAKAAAVTSPSDPASPGGRLYAAYQEILARNRKIDFQDILVSAVSGMHRGSLAPFPVTFMLVDEFQDTDELQYEWVRLHGAGGTRITVVGDDDQSIYGWRRAMGYTGMERFAGEFGAQRVVLGMNYRCHGEILGPSGALIKNNRGRIPKLLEAARGPGGEARFTRFAGGAEEAIAVGLHCGHAFRDGRSAAVLARTNRRLDHVEAAMVVHGLPYRRLGGGSIFDRPEASVLADLVALACGRGTAGVDHALAWAGMPEEDLRAIHERFGNAIVSGTKAETETLPITRNSADTWRDFAKRCRGWREAAERGRAALALSGIAQWMNDHAGSEYQQKGVAIAASVFQGIDAPLERRADELKNRRKKGADGAAVVLTTMHGAKGLEWDVVWIVGAEETVCPDEKAALEEERRLMYVAMTRARDDLTVSATSRNPVSRFVHEAGLRETPPVHPPA